MRDEALAGKPPPLTSPLDTTTIKLGPSDADYVLHYDEGGPQNPEGKVDPQLLDRIGSHMKQEEGVLAFMGMYRTGLRPQFKAFVDKLTIQKHICSSVHQMDLEFAPHDNYEVVAKFDRDASSKEALYCSRELECAPEDTWVTDPEFVGWAQRDEIGGNLDINIPSSRLN